MSKFGYGKYECCGKFNYSGRHIRNIVKSENKIVVVGQKKGGISTYPDVIKLTNSLSCTVYNIVNDSMIYQESYLNFPHSRSLACDEIIIVIWITF